MNARTAALLAATAIGCTPSPPDPVSARPAPVATVDMANRNPPARGNPATPSVATAASGAQLGAGEPSSAGESFLYADGSGNTYQLDGAHRRITYVPMTAERSSSGTYDGGPAWTQVLAPERYAALTDMLNKALSAREQHTKELLMGTSSVKKAGENVVLFKLNTTLLIEFAKQLDGLAPKRK
jgi:hypothetical protein